MPVSWPIIWLLWSLFSGGIQPTHSPALTPAPEVSLAEQLTQQALQTFALLQSA